MRFPTNIGVLGNFVVVQQTGTANVQGRGSTKIGTVMQVGTNVQQVQAYNIVLYDYTGARNFTQNNNSYDIVEETKVLLITPLTT